MGIKRPDGSEYNLSGGINQFNPNNVEHCLFNKWDAEAIRMGGSPIFYYEVIMPPPDPVYPEARNKIYSPFPIQLYCFYEPIPSQNYQNNFGIDAPDEMIFELNYQAVLDAIGHPPIPGSRLFTPHKSENWIIIQRNLSEFKMWQYLRIQLICQKFQESLTTEEGQVTKDSPDNYTIN